jgi:hypothetical protein
MSLRRCVRKYDEITWCDRVIECDEIVHESAKRLRNRCVCRACLFMLDRKDSR